MKIKEIIMWILFCILLLVMVPLKIKSDRIYFKTHIEANK